MLFRILPSRLLLAAAVLALPLTGGGCGRQACFTWTPIEGACPAKAEALQFFSTPRCPGQITSVESAPTSELDGTLCCYEVTANEQVEDPGCQGFGGSNSVAVGSGFDGAGGFEVSTSAGQGGAGGDLPCARCAEVLKNVADAQFCVGPTQDFVNTLLTCACVDRCVELCDGNLCFGAPASPECFNCLQDPAVGCGNELVDCVNDL